MKKIFKLFMIFFISITFVKGAEYQDIILKKINIARREEGLKPLKMDRELNKIAIIKAKDMAKEEKLSHDSKKFGLTFNLIKEKGIRYSSAAENIARGHDTPEFVAKRWLTSKGHRKNILNSNYTHTGIGLAQDKNGKNYWVQLFIQEKK